jgi:hypothetical protein
METATPTANTATRNPIMAAGVPTLRTFSTNRRM